MAVITVSAENWPQWRGPQLNGVSGEKGLPVKWGPEENVAWKLSVPTRSGATPIIWNNHIFLNVALLAENAMNEYTLSSVAVSNGQIFLRTEGHLYAIGQGN
jgi:hypothetical protein